jgi:glycosyltransferase involved in cell wall biosynthesis
MHSHANGHGSVLRDSPSSPKVSIIIPIYNVEQYLSECLNSATRQTLDDIEIICVNDGSPDRSLDIAFEHAALDSRISVIDKFNGGLSSARNAGLEAAQGKYILFLDGDDLIDPELCTLAYERAEALSADIVFFNAVCSTDDAYSTQSFFRYPNISGVFQPRSLPLCLAQVSAWNRLYRRALIQNVHFVPGICHEDQPFSAEINILAERAGIVDLPLYFYRKGNSASITADFRLADDIFQSFDAVKRVLESYSTQEALGPFFAAFELVNYKNRMQALPPKYWHNFFSQARRRLRGVDWGVLMAIAQEYNGTFWPWSLREKYFVLCLRMGSFGAYALPFVIRDWRIARDVAFGIPGIGGLLEWVWAFARIGGVEPRGQTRLGGD